MNCCSVTLLVLMAAYAASECDFKSDWTYRLERVTSNTTNEDAISPAMRAVYVNRRLARKGVNGTMTIGTTLDNDYKVNLKVYRRVHASSDFKLTALSRDNLPFYDFMNQYYKPQLMDELHRCAGQQLFDEMSGPVLPHTVDINECYFAFDCFSQHLAEGFYLVVFELKGPEVIFVLEARAVVEREN